MELDFEGLQKVDQIAQIAADSSKSWSEKWGHLSSYHVYSQRQSH